MSVLELVTTVEDCCLAFMWCWQTWNVWPHEPHQLNLTIPFNFYCFYFILIFKKTFLLFKTTYLVTVGPFIFNCNCLSKMLTQHEHVSSLFVAREAAMWELEERHLQEKHQQLKQQLKDQYFMQRHQLLKRHEKVRLQEESSHTELSSFYYLFHLQTARMYVCCRRWSRCRDTTSGW